MSGPLFWTLSLSVLLPAQKEAPAVKSMTTPAGVRFALMGEKKAKPAPTLFVLANAAEETLKHATYNHSGLLLAEKGVLCVALDVPGHGKDVRPGELGGLDAWRSRLEKGDPWLADFTKRASAVLDHLIKEGYTDAEKVAVCGTSRGGFLALHWAAADSRVGAAAAFAPVTDLLVLREFHGMEKHAATKALDLREHAGKLAGRPIWVCIGNNDERVGTDQVIGFTRKVVAASLAAKKPAPVELHVMPTAGHSVHDTAYDEAAAWLARHWRLPR
jgi:dienelactone hydrolase